jgi:hypothetical protein
MIKLFGKKKKLQIRLYKVDETAHLWIFGFRDPVNKLQQSIILSKEASWDRMESLWDKMHERLAEALAQ